MGAYSHATLNRVYHLVWNAALGVWQVASELTSKHKKGGRQLRVCATSTLLSLPVFIPINSYGADEARTVVETGSNTEVFNAPNKVPVVNIATPNSAGLSHNTYIKYNVTSKGLVLNNLNPSKLEAVSQLAGKLTSNLNLKTGVSAKVILNEVVAPNRSSLNGFTEVFGGKADVIVANPYGVTCSGCGFINSDNVTITTGKPTKNGGGALTGFNVSEGDILISGSGIKATAQETLNIVARTVKLDGRTNAKDLTISTGAQKWDRATRTAVEASGKGIKPTISLDSTALGGMYAGRIKLLANETGVGVRMRGEAASSTDDFSIDSKGNVVIQNKISAERDLKIETKSNATQSYSGSETSLSSKRNTTIISSGALDIDETPITADNDLSITAASLTDKSTNNAARFAKNDTNITVTGNTTLNGSTWGAGNNLSLTTGAFDADATSGATLYAGSDSTKSGKNLSIAVTTGDISLNALKLSSNSNIELDARQGAITSAVTTNDFKAGGDITLKAKTSITNKRKIQAKRDVIIRSNNNAGNLIVYNEGSFEAGRNVDIAGFGATPNQQVDIFNRLSASILADNNTTIKANNIENNGTIQSKADANYALSGNLTNTASGKILTETGSFTVSQSTAITNDGTIQSGKNISLSSNDIDNKSKIQTLSVAQSGADGDINLTGSVNNTGDIISSGAGAITGNLTNSKLLQTAKALDIRNSTIDNKSTGKILAGGDMTVSSNAAEFSLTNAGKIEGKSLVKLGTDSTHVVGLTNVSGASIAAKTLEIFANVINNTSARIQAVDQSTITANQLQQNSSTSILLLSSASNALQSVLTLAQSLSNSTAFS